MPRHRHAFLCALALCLLAACSPTASAQEPFSAPLSGANPTSTPFQPGGAELLTAAPEAHATFTPYPQQQVRGGSFIAPQVATPSGDVDPAASAYNPLTGLVPADPSLLNRRPIAIKISLYPRAIRPQFGLNEADVVYEYYIEWQNTRFIGIFYGDNAKQIGPVRSGRYFDEHITRMYHSYYVFNYADPREFQYFLGGDFQKWVVVPGGTDCPPFFQFRFSTLIKDIYHYETYFDSTRFSECLAKNHEDNTRQNLRSGFFTPNVPEGGIAVDRIFTHYSKCDYNYWEYDPNSGRYMRYQETSKIQTPAHIDDCVDDPENYTALTDNLTGQQVSTANVVELFVSHTFMNENEQQDEIYHINLIDSGNAFVFRDGMAYPARWMRTDIDQPLLLTTLSGTPIYLKPGNTFYQVIGETSTDWSDGADWHFDFKTP